jgi:hypothetical protein
MGHAVPEAIVPRLLVRLRQLDPGLHVDGETFGCCVILEMLVEDGDLSGVVGFGSVEFNQLVERGCGGVNG